MHDTSALSKIYDEYGARLYHYLLAILRSKDDAEDVLQTLFMRLVHKQKRLKVDKMWTNRLFWTTATTLLLFLIVFNFYHNEVYQKKVAKLYTTQVFETFTVKKDNGRELARDLVALLGEGDFRVIQKFWEISLMEPATPTMLELRKQLIGSILEDRI